MWARRADIDVLLAEMIVSVGIEVDAYAARTAIARIESAVHAHGDDCGRMLEIINRVLHEYYQDPDAPHG